MPDPAPGISSRIGARLPLRSSLGLVYDSILREIGRMRNLAMLAALALAGCSVGTLTLGTTNYKGQPLSSVVTKLGSPEEQGTSIAGQKTYTWIRGNALQECRIRVTMAGDVVETYEGFGDVTVCSQYGALAGGLKGYGG